MISLTYQEINACAWCMVQENEIEPDDNETIPVRDAVKIRRIIKGSGVSLRDAVIQFYKKQELRDL